MTRPPALPRLIDLPGVADLEFRALMKPALADPDNRSEYPEIDACSTALFGLTADEAEATPTDLDDIDALTPRDQVDAFEAAGWDVTDDKRRPLRVLRQFNRQLWLALHGVAGSLPFRPEEDADEDLAKGLAAEAARFKRR